MSGAEVRVKIYSIQQEQTDKNQRSISKKPLFSLLPPVRKRTRTSLQDSTTRSSESSPRHPTLMLQENIADEKTARSGGCY